MAAREITPWSTEIKRIDRNARPETSPDDAKEIAPVLLFGSLEFHDSRKVADLRPSIASVPPQDEAKGVAPPADEGDPKVPAGSSATSSAPSSPDGTEESGKMEVPMGTHPSSISDSSEDPASVEKDPNPELLLLP